MNLYKMCDKLSKQPICVAKNTDMSVFVDGKEHYITNIRYEGGKPLGFDAIPIGCRTCRNNVEFPPPHTCDMCTCLESEELYGEYSMWIAK